MLPKIGQKEKKITTFIWSPKKKTKLPYYSGVHKRSDTYSSLLTLFYMALEDTLTLSVTGSGTYVV